MHKQEIIDAYKKGREEHYLDYYPQKHSEEYYQDTFGIKGSDDHIVDTNEMVELPQQEISDEEIEKRVKEVGAMGEYYKMGYRDAIIWYREQLKQKK